jgi:hypothetical protein
MKPEFSGHFRENTQISNVMKIRPVGADGQSDYEEANSRFSQSGDSA